MRKSIPNNPRSTRIAFQLTRCRNLLPSCLRAHAKRYGEHSLATHNATNTHTQTTSCLPCMLTREAAASGSSAFEGMAIPSRNGTQLPLPSRRDQSSPLPITSSFNDGINSATDPLIASIVLTCHAPEPTVGERRVRAEEAARVRAPNAGWKASYHHAVTAK